MPCQWSSYLLNFSLPLFSCPYSQRGGKSDIWVEDYCIFQFHTPQTIVVVSSPFFIRVQKHLLTSRLMFNLGAARFSCLYSQKERLAINLSGWLLHVPIPHIPNHCSTISSIFHCHTTKIYPHVAWHLNYGRTEGVPSLQERTRASCIRSCSLHHRSF